MPARVAETPHHEAQHLALLAVQRVEEVGKAANQGGSRGTQRIELGVQQLLGRLAREPLTGDQSDELWPARQAPERVALLLELAEPGLKAALLPVVKVQLGTHACKEVLGEAVSVSMTAEMMAMSVVAKVVAEFVMGVPATKKVHGVLPWALEALWLGWHP